MAYRIGEGLGDLVIGHPYYGYIESGAVRTFILSIAHPNDLTFVKHADYSDQSVLTVEIQLPT